MTEYILVNNFVGASIVEGVVEAELLVLEVLCEVHLVLGLVHDHLVLCGHADHVHLEYIRY